MIDKIKEQQKLRFLFLKRLHEIVGANELDQTDWFEIGKELGLDWKGSQEVTLHLMRDGLIKYRGDKSASITHEGINEIEEALTNPDMQTTYFPTVNEMLGKRIQEESNQEIFLNGQQFDAYKYIRNALEKAKESVLIEDPYIDEDILDLLSEFGSNIEIRILTLGVSKKFNYAAKSFNKQNKNLYIGTTTVFHDRFLIIDQTYYYFLGSSIKDIGNKVCMCVRIEDPYIKKHLIDKFNSEWKKTKIKVKP